MHETLDTRDAIRGLDIGRTTSAAETGRAKLTLLLRERAALPKHAQSEIRILFARLDPGDRTPTHSHRFPVAVYVTSGIFTLDLDDRGRVEIVAGAGFVEPPGVRMTGHNLGDEPAEMALFYACEPETPFADPAG